TLEMMFTAVISVGNCLQQMHTYKNTCLATLRRDLINVTCVKRLLKLHIKSNSRSAVTLRYVFIFLSCNFNLIRCSLFQATKTSNHQRDQKTHQRSHTGDKMNYCKECVRGFHTPSHCNKHERTHMEVNFSCYQCDKSFRNLSSYSEHKQFNTENKLFHCYQCAKTFTSLSALCKHQPDHVRLKSLDHNETQERERSSSGFSVRLKNLEIRLQRVQMESPVKSVS
uniref:C2H2-type domain-containing protein n=1 Tax=Neolamprologus brichardi TaxID=32507 RepID=A0A3Q4G601_NEOBR